MQSLSAESLPRDRFLLRWTAVERGARYSVQVSTADLTPLAAHPTLAALQIGVSTVMLLMFFKISAF